MALAELKLTTGTSNCCFHSLFSQPLLVCHLMLGLGCVTCTGSSASAGNCLSFAVSLTRLLLMLCPFPTSHVQSCTFITHLFIAGEAGAGRGHLHVGSHFSNAEGYRGENNGAEVSSQSLGAVLPLHSTVIASHIHNFPQAPPLFSGCLACKWNVN